MDCHPLHALRFSSRLIRYGHAYTAMLLLSFISSLWFLDYRFRLDPQRWSALWLVAVASEITFLLLWLISLPGKLFPIHRVTFPEALIARCKGKDPILLPAIDIFITTVDPIKEPPLITVNTVLSALAVDYPVNKVSCYVSDDGGSPLILRAMVEASHFARHWIPFCRKYSIDLRAPLAYFNHFMKQDGASFFEEDDCFAQEFRSMKEEFDKFKARIEFISAMEDGALDSKVFTSNASDSTQGTPQNHVGIIEVLLDRDRDRDARGGFLPNFVYLSREKRANHKHHYKAGAMNALTRISAVMTNAPFILNLDCDMYINHSKALLHSMCFFMDASISDQLAFVQFPQRFENVDEDDLYGNGMRSIFDVLLRCLDGIQGPVYCGTGCVFRRNCIYGCKLANSVRDISPASHEDIQKSFGRSSALASSIQKSFMGLESTSKGLNSVKEALEVVEWTFEHNTDWGHEIGWMYGSVVEDMLTGMVIHARGWRSVSCYPPSSAFVGCAPPSWRATIECWRRWYIGLLQILFIKKSPLRLAGKLKPLQRTFYIWAASRPVKSLPLFLYATIPALCLLHNIALFPMVTHPGMLRCLLLFLCICGSSYLEGWLVCMTPKEWWHGECMENVLFLSSGLFAGVELLGNLVRKRNTRFVVTPKQVAHGGKGGPLTGKASEGGYEFSPSPLFIPATVLVMMNVVGVIVGVVRMGGKGREAAQCGEVFGACWVILNLLPFFQGLYKKGKEGIPISIIAKAGVIASLMFVVFG